MFLSIAILFGCSSASSTKKEGKQNHAATSKRDDDGAEPDIATLIKTINDGPPSGHLSYNPSVMRLIMRGPEVIPHMLPLLASDGRVTRLHAKVVVVGVTQRMQGFEFGKGWTVEGAEQRWKAWWKEMGEFDEDADGDSRARAIQLLTKWWESQRKA
jgi:hypothetical protein